MSATAAIGYPRNVTTISNKCGTKFGPFSKHSLMEAVDLSDLAEPSKYNSIS